VVDEHNPRSGVLEDEADVNRGQPVIDRGKRPSRSRYAVVRFEQDGDVRCDDGDPVAAGEARVLEGRRQPTDSFGEVAIAVAAVLLDDGDPSRDRRTRS